MHPLWHISGLLCVCALMAFAFACRATGPKPDARR
jgi:hypothetical protein